MDTEFNGFGGELISMALVPQDGGPAFYEVRDIPEKLHPWVTKNVIPVLYKSPIGDDAFRTKLWRYLRGHDRCFFSADYPEDIKHVADWLTDPFGYTVNLSVVQFEICPPSQAVSLIPHNALADASALANREYPLTLLLDGAIYAK